MHEGVSNDVNRHGCTIYKKGTGVEGARACRAVARSAKAGRIYEPMCDANCSDVAAGARCRRRPSPAAQPQQVDLIVYNAIVVTMDAAGRVLPRGAVAIRGNQILAVDTAESIASTYSAKETIDAGGQIVMPGLINTHGHAPMVLYRGLADDLALMEWLQKLHLPGRSEDRDAGVRPGRDAAGRARDDPVRDDDLRGHVLLRGGDRARDARGRACAASSVRPSSSSRWRMRRHRRRGLPRTEAFLKEFAGDELITPAVAPHAMYTNDAATLKSVAGDGRQVPGPGLIHLAETADESQTSQKQHKMSPTRYLESLNFWGPRTLAAHAVWLDDADIEILAKRKVGVSHNPESNMKLASGTAKVPAMRTAGDERRPRHRRRRQQQRSRHVRGDAPGRPAAEACDAGPARAAGEGRAGDGDDRRRPRAAAWRTASARSKRANAPT